MKTFNLTVFVLFFFAFSIQAQINLGLKAGLNVSDILSESDDAVFSNPFDTKTGYHVGAFLEGPISNMLGLRAEALFVTKGADDRLSNNELDLNYLNVPLLLKVNPLSFWSIHGGAEFGFKLSESNPKAFEEHNVDIGWAFGTSIKLFQRLGVEVRYLLGTTDLEESTIYTDLNGDPIDVSFKNRSFQISLEYYFRAL